MAQSSCRFPVGSKRSGFTLVEVLIVVGIIGILAALLFPVFRSVREATRRTTCASNLRQIGLGIQQYVQDNNLFYPADQIGNSTTCSWVDAVFPYVKSPQSFQCPSFDTIAGEYRTGCPADYSSTLENPNDPPVTSKFDGGYTLNKMHTLRAQPLPGHLALHEPRLTHPATTLLVMDKIGGFSMFNPTTPTANTTDEFVEVNITVRHNNGVNVLFADGHVKWLSPQAMTQRSLWLASGLP